MIKPPRKSCSAYVIVKTIAEHGPLTMEQGIEIHKSLGQYPSLTKRLYDRAVRSGWLERRGNKYALTDWLREWLKTQEPESKPDQEIVQPFKWNAWTPEMNLNKYITHLRSGFDRRKRED